MKPIIFRPAITPDHKFAVVAPASGGVMAILQTYRTKEKLATGLREWRQIASKRGIARPYPVELVGAGLIDNRGPCRILTEPLEEERLS